MSLENKVALVTGGAQGIGAAIVETLSRDGADVAIVDLSSEKAKEVISNITVSKQRVISIVADISKQSGCKFAIRETVGQLGRLDMLINNAAPQRDKKHIGKLLDVEWGNHEEIVLQSVVWLTHYAECYLKQSQSGAIVNISSVIANKVSVEKCSWPYHVSKAGLDQLTRYLACKLGEYNIRVNAVAPGLVDRSSGVKLTDYPENREIIDQIVPLKRAANGSDIGNVVSFLCSAEASYLTGQTITVDGGLGLMEAFGAAVRLNKYI